MTRELKLALIVGFSLVLVVTVLVSDHLSRARRVTLADAGTAGALPANGPSRLAMTEPPPFGGGLMGGAPDEAEFPSRSEGSVAGLDGGARAGGDGALPASRAAGPGTEPGPDVIVLGPSRGGTDIAGEIRRAGGVIREAANMSEFELPPSAIKPERRAMDDRAPGEGGSEAASGERSRPAGEGIRDPIKPAPRDLRYTVTRGDTLSSIAARYLGSASQWRRLAEHNKLKPDAVLREGSVLNIPTMEPGGSWGPPAPSREDMIRMIREESGGGKSAAKAPERGGSRGGPGGAAVSLASYTVKRGDTLGHISQRLLGTTKRQGEILKLNPDLKGDPDSIREGDVLKIPGA